MDERQGEKISWTIGEVSTSAARALATNWKALTLATLVLLACLAVPIGVTFLSVGVSMWASHSVTSQVVALLRAASIVSIGLMAIGMFVLMAMFGPSLLSMLVAAARGQRLQAADLFRRPFQRLGALAGATLLTSLLTGLGMVLLLVPGIVLMFGLSLSQYFIIEDEQISAGDALRASWRAMRGHKLHYVGMVLLLDLPILVVNMLLSLSLWLLPLKLAFVLASNLFGALVLATLYARLNPRSVRDAAQPLLVANV